MVKAEQKSPKEQWQSYSKKQKIAVVILAIVAVALFANILSSSSDTSNPASTTTQNSTTSPAPETRTPKIGEPARDGKFEFTIRTFECGATTLGDNEFFREEAQGKFCVMKLLVKNVGNEAQTFSSSDQKALNAQNQQFSNDSGAETALESNSWYEQINPGNSVEGIVVFDVPQDETITSAELHDSFLSGGVKVSLQ